MLHTVTWLCPHHHHSHGSSGRGQHPRTHPSNLPELRPVVTVPYHPSHLYITHNNYYTEESDLQNQMERQTIGEAMGTNTELSIVNRSQNSKTIRVALCTVPCMRF